MILAGFFVYGPQSSFWPLCPDLLGTTCAGTGVGVMNSFAYLFAGLGEPLIGALIDSSGDTGSVFGLTAVFCWIGALIVLFVRR
jgi:OPA family glycerol-3-phosphate transporter-like MFS transporter